MLSFSRWMLFMGWLFLAFSSSPRAQEKNAKERATAFLLLRPEAVAGIDLSTLKVDRVKNLSSGSLVHFRQEILGLEVAGGGVTVRFDDSGQVRWMRSTAVVLPKDFNFQPSISAEQAVAIAWKGPARRQGNIQANAKEQTKLVLYAPPRLSPRLAWHVLVPANRLLLETLRVYVDAKTGTVISSENLVKHKNLAQVYPTNPVKSPGRVQVTLPVPVNQDQLIGPDVLTNNCIDRHNCMEFETPYGTFSVHFCDMAPEATADALNGDFLLDPASDTEPEDWFAEVSMYYQVSKAYAVFRSFDPSFALNARPLTAVVNFRMPAMDVASFCLAPGVPNYSPLSPFDNAAFMPAGTLGNFPPQDEIIFGQGTNADFSYDGDVVYHEFTHAAIMSLTPLGSVVEDEYGLDPTPAALHEGYADYFSCVIAGDPEVGEYAGNGLVSDPLPSGALRTLRNDHTCPADLSGESHEDSQIWSGALWDIREALLAANVLSPDIDKAVFNVIHALEQFDNQTDAQTMTIAEIAASIGQQASEIAASKFSARGVNGCRQRVMDMQFSSRKKMLFMYGTDALNETQVPGVVQFKIVLPEDATAIRVEIDSSQSGGYGTTPSLSLLVKPGEDPIRWDWLDTVTNDSTHQGPVAVQGGSGRGSGTVNGNFPAGTYHLQLSNAGSTWMMEGIRFEFTPGDLDGGTDGGEEDGGDGQDGFVDGGDKPPNPTGEPGCGCGQGGAAGFVVFLGWIAIVIVAMRRKPCHNAFRND
jgi:hypothetical protein